MRKVIVLMFLFMVMSCGYKSKETIQEKAYVYKSTLNPRRGGYFYSESLYRFIYNGDTINGRYGTNKFPIAHEGDSLIVQFPIGSPQRVKVVEIIPTVNDDNVIKDVSIDRVIRLRSRSANDNDSFPESDTIIVF